jgi:cytochrome c
MKSKLAFAVAAAGLLIAGTAQASPELAEKSGCNKCHAMDTKKMGASYKDLAKKHKGTADADLVKKLVTGQGHPKAAASEADVTALVKWIKSL